MGHQFLHCYSFSQEGKHTVSGCLGEALREKGFTSHIETPLPPEWVYGSEMELRQAIAAYRDGFKDSRGHRLRKDGQILRGDVVSWGPDMTEAEVKEADKKTIEYYKAKYGKAFRGAVRHTDEPFKDPKYGGRIHYHLHPFIVPEPDQKFEDIHPGLKAKRAEDKVNKVIEKKHRPSGELTEDQKRELVAAAKVEKGEAKAWGNIAYKKAMTVLQDEFFSAVCEQFGMTRTGPRRERMNQQKQKFKNDAQKEVTQIKSDLLRKEMALDGRDAALQKKENDLDEWDGAVTLRNDAVNSLATVLNEQKTGLDAREGELTAAKKALDARKDKMDKREKALDDREAKAKETEKKFDVREAAIRNVQLSPEKTHSSKLMETIFTVFRDENINQTETPKIWKAVFAGLAGWLKQVIQKERTQQINEPKPTRSKSRTDGHDGHDGHGGR